MLKALSSERGITTVEFLLYAGLVVFLIFGSIDYWITGQRINQVEHLKNYYLDRVRLEGYLTVADENELVGRLTAAGFEDITIDAPKESAGWPRVLRSNDLSASEVWLRIRCRMVPRPFVFAQAIGGGVPGDFYVDVGGRALSERVEP